MGWTKADLEAVDKAIIDLATNRRPVKFVIDGNVVEYSPVQLPQLRELRNEIAAEVSAADSTSGSCRSFVVYGGKGL